MSTIDAIRAGKLDSDDKLVVLAATVHEIVNKHGHVTAVGIALKTMSNFTGNILHRRRGRSLPPRNRNQQ